MKVITPGHKYELENFENKDKPGQVIQFIEKTPRSEGSPVLQTVNDGTTNEEMLAVLLDRLRTMNTKLPCRESSIAITKIEEALLWLNHRTAQRKARSVEGTMAA